MSLSKKINTPLDLRSWTRSAAYSEIMEFIEAVNFSIRSRSIDENKSYSEEISRLVDFLRKLEEHIEQVPLEQNPQRFGNKAFRNWHKWLCDNGIELLVETLKNPEISEDDLKEISIYITESVGNPIRIDYGTGHELAYISFMLCLFKTNYLHKEHSVASKNEALSDYASVGLVIFPAYLRLVRRLQTYFKMEPAGSHGVWSLDDFQFVPYIWGSSQLIGTGSYEPRDIPSQEIASRERDSNLLFSCIDYIFQVKTGPFAEHSSTLQGISNLPHWEKVNSGMLKMYRGEVLDKFPIVQHFLFGSLLKLDAAPQQQGPPARVRLPPPSGVFRTPNVVPSVPSSLNQ